MLFRQWQKRAKRETSASKRMVFIASALFFILLLGNAFSSIKTHRDYQIALMDSVTNNVLLEYQEHLTRLRLEIDQFQFRHQNSIRQIFALQGDAQLTAYEKLLATLKSSIEHTRLFAIVDEQGSGTLGHITGDFLPDCKEEIRSTLDNGSQENLFLHHSKTSVHFDILQPLITHMGQKHFFFVAFNPQVFEQLLTKYQLPYQQLYLLRSDHVGKIELTTVPEANVSAVTMSAEDINEFSYLKAIPGTRWQLAIKLSPEYSTEIMIASVSKALFIWFLITALIYLSYRLQKVRIKKQRQVESELAFTVNHDSLTGLMNRSSFSQRLNLQLAQSPQDKTGVALLIDIDKFQLINNSFGYSTGDACLHMLSLSIKSLLPNQAQMSRLGNDEFAVLLPDLAHDDAITKARSLRDRIQEFRFNSIASDIKITACIGVVLLDEVWQNSEQVFSALAQAVTVAKEKGRNRVQAYQSQDDALTRHAQDMRMVSAMSKALNENRFVLYRQKVKSLKEDSVRQNYEVLVRMVDESNQLVAPGLFIPAAEKFGLINQLDQWVLTATFAAIAKERAQGVIHHHYGINLSGITLGSKDIITFVDSLFEQYQIPPNCIGFEITETAAVTHLTSATSFIEHMTQLGCEFSLDDFGSGISSFSYLQQLPVQGIKIDGSFVKDINNPLNQVFVEMMQKVARAMGKKTIAEFVENDDIENALIKLDVDCAQGYHIHKPELWFKY